MDARSLRFVILVLGLSQVAQAAWLLLSPGSFYDAFANFGPRSDHALRDNGTLTLGLGVALLMSLERPSWRTPVLAVAGLQIGLHAVNHAYDIGNAEPGWVGPVDFVALVALAAISLLAARAAARTTA